MNKISIYLKTFLLFLALSLFTGCVSQQQNQIKERYFWPPPPDEPKIEWIGSYSSQLDISKRANVLSFLTGEEDADGLLFPTAIAADGQGKVYVSDIGRFAVIVFDFNAKDTHILGGGTSEGLLEKPSGIDFDENGNIYVGDLKQNKIIVFNKSESPVQVLEMPSIVKNIGLFKLDTKRKRIIIPDTKAHQIVIIDYAGKLIKTISLFDNKDGKDGFRFPAAVDLDPEGNIVVADTVNARIVRLTPEGDFLSTIGVRGDNVGTIDFVKGVAVDSEGHIYMVDFRSNRLQIFNNKGQLLTAIGDKGLKDLIGTLASPSSIYIDKNDTIYITEPIAKRFQVFQYMTKEYILRNPITDKTPVAKPMEVDKSTVKNR